MKKIILLFTVILFPLFVFSQFDLLVWEDNFEYAGLPDSTKWSYDIGGHGWGNQELQYYTEKRLENARVENGKLIIEARKEIYNGKNYTSARLVSKNKGDWAYGRIEIRAKLPQGRGTWPAIWMLPTEWIYGDGGWPDVGEIDIMEHVGYDEGVIHGTIHTHDYNHMNGTQKSGQITIEDATSTFHVYAIEWTKDKIEWFVDDQKFFTYQNTGSGWSAWPFDHPFHLIMNIAIGGTWGGVEGVDNSIFPQKLEIDYVRVYKTENQLDALIEGRENVVPNAAHVKYSPKILNASDHQWTVPVEAEMVSQDTNGNIWVNWGCNEGDIILSANVNNTSYFDTLSVQSKEPTIQGNIFWKDNSDPLLFFLDSMHGTTYEWSVPAWSNIISGQGSDSLFVEWGNQRGAVNVTIDNACISKEISRTVLDPNGQYAYPDPYQPHKIPGTISSVNYDYGGEGVAYHDQESLNRGDGPRQNEGVDTEYMESGGNVGWIENGEWLEYSIQVEEDLWVEADFRVASLGGGGPLKIRVNGEEKVEGVTIPDTQDWSNFISHNVGLFQLTTEDSVLRIEATGGGFNLGNMVFTKGEPTAISNSAKNTEFKIYPNPVSTHLIVLCENEMKEISLFNIHGSMIEAVSLPSGKKRHTLNTAALPAGVYLLRLLTDSDKFVSKTFIKR